MDKFGTYAENSRGWPRVDFEDHYGKKCSLQLSSIVLDYEDSFERPGTSAVWLGISGTEAMVMARDAASVGINPMTDVGWVPYPIPKEVQVTTRMHLNRVQVEGLRDRLTEWLETGQLSSNPSVKGSREAASP